MTLGVQQKRLPLSSTGYGVSGDCWTDCITTKLAVPDTVTVCRLSMNTSVRSITICSFSAGYNVFS